MEYFFSTAALPEHPFILFGWSHLLLAGWVAVFGYTVIRFGIKSSEARRKQIRTAIIVLFVFWELEWQIWHILTATWTLQNNLPLHLCSVMIWVSVYGLWTRNRVVYKLMYFFGIAGAIQAVITPDSIYAFPHLRTINSMFSHSLLVIAGFWVVFVEQYRPTLRDIGISLIAINIYAIPIYLINLSIGSNFLYIGVAAKPSTASLMDLFPSWPWYLPILEVLLIAMMLAMYLPFARHTKSNE